MRLFSRLLAAVTGLALFANVAQAAPIVLATKGFT